VRARHSTWFTAEAEAALKNARLARVAADPAVVPQAAVPGGCDGFVYYRLHGSPRTYYSAYDDVALHVMGDRLRAATVPSWCTFDNIALDAATANALELIELLRTV
jgi:uncharacterized protein YecE (DUF72 family)